MDPPWWSPDTCPARCDVLTFQHCSADAHGLRAYRHSGCSCLMCMCTKPPSQKHYRILHHRYAGGVSRIRIPGLPVKARRLAKPKAPGSLPLCGQLSFHTGVEFNDFIISGVDSSLLRLPEKLPDISAHNSIAGHVIAAKPSLMQ